MYIDCSDIKGVVNLQVSIHTKEYSCLLSQVFSEFPGLPINSGSS